MNLSLIKSVDLSICASYFKENNNFNEKSNVDDFENPLNHINANESMEIEQNELSINTESEDTCISNFSCSAQSDTDIKFDDQLDDNKGVTDRIDYFIYENATIKTSQFNLLLSLFISRFSLSKKCSKELLKLISFLLPQPNKVCKTVEKLYANHNLNTPVKKYVCAGCWKSKANVESCCENTLCMYNQGTASSIKENGLEVLYLDASQQLESILKRERSTIIKYKAVSVISNFILFLFLNLIELLLRIVCLIKKKMM